MEGGGCNIVKNGVTSFMDDPRNSIVSKQLSVASCSKKKTKIFREKKARLPRFSLYHASHVTLLFVVFVTSSRRNKDFHGEGEFSVARNCVWFRAVSCAAAARCHFTTSLPPPPRPRPRNALLRPRRQWLNEST